MAKRITLEEKFVNYVRNAVDLTVGNTGYPVLGRYLTESGVASREQLRQLERKGHIKSVRVNHNVGKGRGTQYQAYYTEREVPEWVKKQDEKHSQVASEV